MSTEGQNKSRLGASLLTSISGGKVEIDQDESPFDSLRPTTIDKVGSRNEERCEAIDESNERPERLTRPIKSGGSPLLILGMLAALGISVYGVFIANGISQKLDSTSVALTNHSEEVTSRIELIESTQKEVKADISQHANAIEKKLATSEDIVFINNKINALTKEIDSIKGDLNSIKVEVGSQEAEIKTKEKYYKQLETQVKGLNTKVSSQQQVIQQKAATFEPRPVYVDPTRLEDATVVSLDQWGAAPMVVLRTNSGQWKSVAIGDAYEGWKLDAVLDGHAVFKKNGETKSVSAEQ